MLHLVPVLAGLLATTGLASAAKSGSGSASTYQVQTPPLTTEWTYTVGTDPWPEYPRPQMAREKWQSLNGIWSYKNAVASDIAKIPSGDLGTAIMIPSCIESALSGVMAPLEPEGGVKYSWFQTTFDIPSSWKEDNVVINFGAVDWEATVFVNGKKAGHHLGGWTKFSIDITKHLSKNGENELAVFVFDPTDEGDTVIPVGKQTLRPEHIFYTPCSGIWGTVFIEPVPKSHITHLEVDGNMHGQLTLKAMSSDKKSAPVEVTVVDSAGKAIGSGSGKSNEQFTVSISNPALWSPEHPSLYDIKITMGDDNVKAYTGFRSIDKGEVNGVVRPMLNGEFYLAFGTLDQGYWPDGLMTPPNHEAMVYDLKVLKDLGFNMLRKHIKVEPDLYYRACDEMGLLVMQDMPSMRPLQNLLPTPKEQEVFEDVLWELIESHRSFPSIYTWVVYNEGWGQLPSHPELHLAPKVKELDPTRLVNAASGWHDRGAGDYIDNHHYSMPQCGTPFYSIASSPYDPTRIGFQGEFGGVAHNTSMEHIWNVEKSISQINMTYEIDDSIPVWNERAHELLDVLRDQIQRYACSGGIYTQTTDVEGEMNGLITYDRRLHRYDAKQWKADIQALYDAAASRGGTRIGSTTSLGHAVLQAKQWAWQLWSGKTTVARVAGL